MAIKKVSKLVSLMLMTIMIGFTFSVSWSLNHLNQSFASVKFFGEQKDKVFTQVSQPILNYLLTGEATTLSKINQDLSDIKKNIENAPNLSASLQAPFLGLIDELQQKTIIDLTAAGKLADPQVLLINNEKQLSQYLQKLLLYVKEAENKGLTTEQPVAKSATIRKKSKIVTPPEFVALEKNTQMYLKLIGNAQAALINLARNRQNFFTSQKQVSSDTVMKSLQDLIVLGDEFKTLPLLGIMKQEAHNEVMSFNDSTDTQKAEDKAIEPINEIPSLLQHYHKDIETALKVARNKVEGQTKVSEQISSLQERLLTLEAELAAEYHFYEHLTFIIMAICGALIVFAMLGCIFGGKRILNRISSLELTMSSIAETGDLSLRANALHSDEIGNMARSFNSMVEKLQETSKLVRQKINDIQTMLKNMPQGLLSFNDENKVNPEYSAYLERILETNQIANANLIELVFSNSNLGSDGVSQVAAVSGACIGEDLMNFEFNSHLLINEIEKEMPDGTKKILDLNWAPVVNEQDIVEQILLCVRDVTELRKLSAEAADQKRELEIIGEILAVKQESFNAFIASAITYISEIENMIRANPNGDVEIIDKMFRNMHTIKGNARTYGLSHLTNLVHDIESGYSELRKPNSMIAWEQTRLIDELVSLHQLVEHYARVNDVSLGRKGVDSQQGKYLLVDTKHIHDIVELLEKVSNTNMHDLIEAKNAAQKTLRLLGTEELDTVLASIVNSLPTLAEHLDKATPRVDIDNANVRLKIQSIPVIKDIFTHLFRNCLDHGLEPSATRLESGKLEQGCINVSIKAMKEQLQISIKDDGRGLALGKIREKALNDGRIQTDEFISDEQLAEFVFLAGLSTADKLTDVSGRGVGMDAVRGFARKEGGDVKINFLDANVGANFRAIETVVYLPLSCAVIIE